MDNKNNAFELNDEELEKAVGGEELPGEGQCPNNHTKCSRENCMNPVCEHLRVRNRKCYCDKRVFGVFMLGPTSDWA